MGGTSETNQASTKWCNTLFQWWKRSLQLCHNTSKPPHLEDSIKTKHFWIIRHRCRPNHNSLILQDYQEILKIIWVKWDSLKATSCINLKTNSSSNELLSNLVCSTVLNQLHNRHPKITLISRDLILHLFKEHNWQSLQNPQKTINWSSSYLRNLICTQ